GTAVRPAGAAGMAASAACPWKAGERNPEPPGMVASSHAYDRGSDPKEGLMPGATARITFPWAIGLLLFASAVTAQAQSPDAIAAEEAAAAAPPAKAKAKSRRHDRARTDAAVKSAVKDRRTPTCVP